MTSASERLALLREKLDKAREENLKAVEDEGMQATISASFRGANADRSGTSGRLTSHQRKAPLEKQGTSKRGRASETYIDVGSADEADGEDEDGGVRSMKRRARKLRRDVVPVSNEDDSDGESKVVLYGGSSGAVSAENADRMVEELQQVEERRSKFRRRRTFNEDRSDITFINEGNRLFNRTLERHFDKFESVQKIKDSLERGTG